ncbi:MAG TPA: ABC transporter ATP-binding protein, partial [Solirubrobacteraceae bacterium]|nr:ABC transporter ATP-binding protein [Solirubrobacteraceae bacterium]
MTQLNYVGLDAGRARTAPLLAVEDLHVSFPTEAGAVRAVDGVSFTVGRGRALGIVGESGSGKSVCALSLLGLAHTLGAETSGVVAWEGRDLLGLPERKLRALRGNELAMIFQDPLSALHPLHRVGAQITEAIRAHRAVARRAARTRAIELLELVGIPEPHRRVNSYPHELSGGMRQRAMIAMALANEPKLLIADEPTTALDVTVQAQILALLRGLRTELDMALLLVSHDLGVVAELADEIAVMRTGRIVEQGPAERLLRAPEHPYTVGLLEATPRLDGAHARGGERVDEKKEGEGGREGLPG